MLLTGVGSLSDARNWASKHFGDEGNWSTHIDAYVFESGQNATIRLTKRASHRDDTIAKCTEELQNLRKLLKLHPGPGGSEVQSTSQPDQKKSKTDGTQLGDVNE